MEQIHLFDIYQKKSLLPSLGSSDEIYKKLKESADELVELLKKEPLKIPNYVLVALDNNITESEPVLEEVEKVISGKWLMLRSHFEAMPIALYRAVIFEALGKLVTLETKFASAVWLTAVDVYPLLDIPSKEQSIIKEFFDQLGDHVEEKAIADWKVGGSNVEVKIPKFEYKQVKSAAAVDEEGLTEELNAASGPHNANNHAGKSPNQHWPNNGPSWSYQFAPRAAAGIAAVVNDALTQQTADLNKNGEALQTSLNAYFTELGKNMKIAISEASKGSVAVERRSQLLWWKETMYSKTLHKSYRRLNIFEASIAIAYDLYYQLPGLFPVSVDYILREVFQAIYGAEQKEIKLIDYLEDVGKSENKELMDQFLDNEPRGEGRMDFVHFLQKVVFTKVDLKKALPANLGVKADKLLSYEDISLWILHSLATNYLLKPSK